MLTKKQNLLETIKGGRPDRFVNQYEFMELTVFIPGFKYPLAPGQTVKDDWGITFDFPEGQIGAFPLHDDKHKVIKDITQWREQVKAPRLDFKDEEWGPVIEQAGKVNREEQFLAACQMPGIFEMTHHLMGMEDALMALYEEPEEMHGLIALLKDQELRRAELIIERLHPDALFHHDDWGGQASTFLSPNMYADFFLEPYKEIYKFWKDNGIELIVHHSDSYAATYVPLMIEMGIDIWQGTMTTNDIPKLIEAYGKQITFMGGLDSGVIDFPEWTPEICAEHVEKACRSFGKHYFIPCLTQGLPFSSFPGVYDEVSRQIDIMSKKMF
ncbi:Uroporphyrinogen-III decarboxylase [Desulfosarcina cetonica]|uniref:uroporphyrinogen decarboxylase family protein n=1 Tax=Desulfosarcina cetonica TaxID=90730 RepID=UPI0006D2A3AC|nr:uroporphyrinogen decarboxylase family protein [Desulfosarcina cetonica]VTR67481.1 Uroporphyrinogen-III decarboxylase [Desulfosarcina cetonica]